MKIPMASEAFEQSKGSPLRATDAETVSTESPTHHAPAQVHAPIALEPGPQLSPFGGMPMGTGVGGQSGKLGMGRTSEFSAHDYEPNGAKYQVQQFIGGDAADALAPDMSPHWLGGKTLGPAVPRWEEQPERSVGKESIAPSPKLVSPTASSY